MLRQLFIGSSIIIAMLSSTNITCAQENTTHQEVLKTEMMDNEWIKAKKAGYSKEEFNAIMNIPNQGEVTLKNSRATLTPQQTAVINTAKKYIGVPYIWGGNTPKGFDCSGLVQYVYKKAVNITLPRITTEQEKYGKSISLNTLQPGDLVFWGKPGSSTHDAIYIGNGQYIHAPQPGQNVCVGEMKYWKPTFARRILKNTQHTPVSCNHYITVTKKSFNLYKDTSLNTIKQKSDNLYQKTLKTNKYILNDKNKKYYALYDKNNNFQGYLSQDALQISERDQAGIFLKDNYYINFKKLNYKIWRNLNFTHYISTTNNQLDKTYHVKGHYNHFNGQKYLSLYDSKNNWYGYINSSATLKANSIFNTYHNYKKYVTVTKKDINIYKDKLLSQPVAKSNQYLNQTVYARGYYDVNYYGKKYMSIFKEDKNDKDDGLRWIGYIEQSATSLGEAKGSSKGGKAFTQKDNTFVSVKKDNYRIWKDLNFSKKVKTAQKNHWYELKNKYHHFNTSWYGSLYEVNRKSGKRTFIGYINMDALQIENNNFGEYHSLRKYAKVDKKNTRYGLYSNKSLSSTVMVNHSFNMVGKTYYIQGYYDLLPTKDNKRGGRFYSIRIKPDTKWLGYMRSTAFR